MYCQWSWNASSFDFAGCGWTTSSRVFVSSDCNLENIWLLLTKAPYKCSKEDLHSLHDCNYICVIQHCSWCFLNMSGSMLHCRLERMKCYIVPATVPYPILHRALRRAYWICTNKHQSCRYLFYLTFRKNDDQADLWFPSCSWYLRH